MASSFGGSVKLSGESEYISALKNINSNLKSVSSELKLSTTNFNNNGKTIGDLRTKNDALNKKLSEEQNIIKVCESAIKNFTEQQVKNKSEIDKLRGSLDSEKQSLEKMKNSTTASSDEIAKQEKVVADLSKELQQAESTYDNNNRKINDYTVKMNDAKSNCSNLSKEISDNNNILSKAKDNVNDNAKSIKDFADKEEKASDSSLKLGDIIKANLISDAIKSGLKSLASGISNVASSLTSALTSGANYADELATLSTQTGISTTKLQEYNAIADLVDVSTDTLTSSMAKNIKQMSNGSDAYKKLGVSIKDSNGNLRDSDTVYWECIDALGKMENETERDALAMSLFGKSAQDLNPLIAQGSDGIAELSDKAHKMGAVLSEDALAGLNSVQDEMDIFGSTTKATGNILASAFAPSIATMMGGVNDCAGAFNGLISSIINGDEGSISDATDYFASTVEGLINNIGEQAPKMLEVGSNLLKSLITAITDNLPKLLESGVAVLSNLLNGITESLPNILPVVVQAITTIVNGLIQNLPTIINAGLQILLALVQGIGESLPTLIPTIVEAVITIAETLLDNIDMIIDAGISILMGLVEGIIDALPELIDKIPVIIDKLINAITNNLPKLIEAGIKLTVKLAEGLIKAIPQLVSKLPQIITSIVKGLISGIGSLADVGKNLIQGLWNGINNAKDWVLDKIKGFGKAILNGIKGIFGIHSPSRVFRDEIGVNLAKGIGVGFQNEMTDVNNMIQKSLPTDLNIATRMNLNNSGSKFTSGSNNNSQPISNKVENNTYNFYSPKDTPSEYARQIRKEKQYLDLVGA